MWFLRMHGNLAYYLLIWDTCGIGVTSDHRSGMHSSNEVDIAIRLGNTTAERGKYAETFGV